MTIGQRIKTLRERVKLTQDKFAELCEATKGAVSQWEKNTTTPKTQNLIMLRDALLKKMKIRVSIDWILFGDAPYTTTDASVSAHLIANPISTYHPRAAVQRACDLTERLSDEGLAEAITYLEFLAVKHPVNKAKLA